MGVLYNYTSSILPLHYSSSILEVCKQVVVLYVTNSVKTCLKDDPNSALLFGNPYEYYATLKFDPIIPFICHFALFYFLVIIIL